MNCPRNFFGRFLHFLFSSGSAGSLLLTFPVLLLAAALIPVAKLSRSDVVIFCGGLSPALEGEELQVNLPGFYKGDRTAIELPAPQRDIIKEIKRRTGKPIVLVLCTGSAIGLEEIVDDVDAIVVAWYGGQDMGTAVVNALNGFTNGFGRLPVTFYKSTTQLPPFDDYNMSNRTYRYMEAEPLFPFGYGLSYGHFHYDSVRFDRESLTVRGVLTLDSDDGFLAYRNEIIPPVATAAISKYPSIPSGCAAITSRPTRWNCPPRVPR